METSGRERRLRRLFDVRSGRTVILPIDQPVTLGPLAGLESVAEQVQPLLRSGPDAVVAHPGLLRRLSPALPAQTTLIAHLSAGTALSGRGHVKTLSGTVAGALRTGADAVSVQVTFGIPEERGMIADLGAVAAACAEWGVPLLAMCYVHEVDPVREPAKIAHAARAAAELGADVVKVPYTGSAESFATVTRGCFAPVVVAGGERSATWEDVLTMARTAVVAGAAGVCIGRNVFQHEQPTSALAELRATVHERPLRAAVPVAR